MSRARQERESRPAVSARTWRTTTAVRCFALALVTGQALSADTFTQAAPALFSLLLVAAVSSALDFGVAGRGTPWIPVVEGLLAAVLLTSAPPDSSILVYLAVPALVAGVRHGTVTTINTTLTTTASVFAVAMSYSADVTIETARLSASAPSLVIGLGLGLLASWQTRALRKLEASQAPYAAAHQLMTQLHTLAQAGTVGLDPATAAQVLTNKVRQRTGAACAALYVRGPSGGFDRLASFGDVTGYDALAASHPEPPSWGSSLADLVLPLIVGDHSVGLLVLGRDGAWPAELRTVAHAEADELALRLETTLLFDEVRTSATSEERHRLAREIHDGVAQEIVALGYLVDEIESTTGEASTLASAEALRSEITRVVAELRFSIFDLRHELAEQHLSGALAEYVREISAGSDLRVHLVLDEQGPPLPRRVESELLRIAQEALGNVRKHARASNVWVSLVTDEGSMSLQVEDDGIGAATPKDRHYGLHTMRERAHRIGADLTIVPRSLGGTAVIVTSRPSTTSEEIDTHDHSPAGR